MIQVSPTVNFIRPQQKGLMSYINQDLSVTIVTSYKFSTNLEVLPIEITLVKRKILLPGLYRPPSYSEKEFFFIWKMR